MANLTTLNPLLTYTRLEKLGEGTSGEVWKVQGQDGNIYAIKSYKPGCEVLVFEEFEQMQKINHSAIVKEYEIGAFQGKPSLVMEYVEGVSLENAKLRDYSMAQIEAIFLEVAKGLEHAHEHKIIHRDLKPANIIIKPDGSVKILDFGAASTLSFNPHQKILGGSYNYMSPEQLAGKVNFQSDIWSFGVTMYEWLVSKHPYEADTLEDLGQQMLLFSVEVPHFVKKKFPRKLSYILLHCLKVRLDDRYRNFSAVIKDLEGDPLKELEASFKVRKWFSRDLVKELTVWNFAKAYSERVMGLVVLGCFLGGIGVMITGGEGDGLGLPLHMVKGLVMIFGSVAVYALWLFLTKPYMVAIKEDLMGVSCLTNKQGFEKLMNALYKSVSFSNSSSLQTGAREPLINWFWRKRDAAKLKTLIKHLKNRNSNSLTLVGYELHQALTAGNMRDASQHIQRMLHMDPMHAVAILNKKFIQNQQGEIEPEVPVAEEELSLGATVVRTENTSVKTERQSEIARKVIENGSFKLPLYKHELILFDSFLEIVERKGGLLESELGPFVAAYDTITHYDSLGQQLEFSGEFSKHGSERLAERIGVLAKDRRVKDIQFKSLEDARLWFEFLREVAPEAKEKEDLTDIRVEELEDSMVVKTLNVGGKFLSGINNLFKVAAISGMGIFLINLGTTHTFSDPETGQEVGGAWIMALVGVAVLAFFWVPRILEWIRKKRMGKEQYKLSQLQSKMDVRKLVYQMLNSAHLNPSHETAAPSGVKVMKPFRFDFDQQSLGVGKKRFPFAEVEEIVFSDSSGRIKMGNEKEIKFSYNRSALDEYLPWMAKLWGDRITFKFL